MRASSFDRHQIPEDDSGDSGEVARMGWLLPLGREAIAIARIGLHIHDSLG